METILKEIQKRYDLLEEKYGKNRILGVFLYGSQNYKLSTSRSDIDVQAIYIPTLLEIGMNKTPISKELDYEGAHIIVKDVRLMCEMWKKQNINFVEILFTEYAYVNPFYQKLWDELKTRKEDIAHYDMQKTITSVSCQMFNTIKGGKVTGKQLANAGRFVYFLQHYIAGYDYLDCIQMDEENLNTFIEYKKSLRLYNENDEKLTYLRKELNAFTKMRVEQEGKEILKTDLDETMGEFCIDCIIQLRNWIGI